DREDYTNARSFYDAARRAAPDAPSRRDVAAATAELAREQRPVVAFTPNAMGDPGWRMTSRSAADNSGVSFLSVDASRSNALSDGFTADIDIGAERIAQG